MGINNTIYSIRQTKNYKRIDEFKARKKFRLWKVGKQLKNSDDWWIIIALFVPALIFDNAKPQPVSIGTQWINHEAYFDEGWISSVSWSGTAYDEYQELLDKAVRDDQKAWKNLQEVAEIITTYQIPEKDPHRLVFIQAAKIYQKEYSKLRLIVDNTGSVLKFLEQFQRLPTPEEWKPNK